MPGHQQERDSGRNAVALEVSRARRVAAWRPYVAAAFIVLGLAPVAVELFRYWLKGDTISGSVIAIGGVIGFLGAYMLNHNDTKDAASFIVTNGIAIIGAIRGGRRATDPPVIVDPPAPPTPPAPVPTPTPTPTPPTREG